nr:UPF0481 protein At3g47200-like [Quercus suber]
MPQDKEPVIQWHHDCCIYKVPKRLRKVKEEAYTPKLISIGPIHRGNLELKDMEMRKQRYCNKFFCRIKKTKEEFESFIEENKDKIRNCYAEEITLPCGKEFVNVILLDSIFIIELFWMTFKREDNRKEYILSKPWLEEGIKNDLILLENQLPFFILHDLSEQSGCNISFITLACNYFCPGHEDLYTEMEAVKHFTDFYRHFYHPPNQNLGYSIEHLYSATKLDTSGLIFQNKEDVELLVDKRIIVNSLGSNEAVADMVNKLCLEIVEVRSYYSHIAGNLNKHYDSPWKQNMASLKNVYFRDIWRGTATVVGVLVLLMTIINFLRPFAKHMWLSRL